ncbi:hypothetical protein U9M48_005732 [Paspalum notatum var. saurae]|uniref:Uncharacterized protein n=1 Tax=Paspalum notatum var. saurae TaxID=547442 RepID=A0AAQ3SFN0_PASNO
MSTSPRALGACRRRSDPERWPLLTAVLELEFSFSTHCASRMLSGRLGERGEEEEELGPEEPMVASGARLTTGRRRPRDGSLQPPPMKRPLRGIVSGATGCGGTAARSRCHRGAAPSLAPSSRVEARSSGGVPSLPLRAAPPRRISIPRGARRSRKTPIVTPHHAGELVPDSQPRRVHARPAPPPWADLIFVLIPRPELPPLVGGKIQTEGRTSRSFVVLTAMALPAKKVSLSVAVVILLFCAASFSLHHARSRRYGKIQSTWGEDRGLEASFRRYGKIQSTWEDKGLEAGFRFYVNMQRTRGEGKYQTYSVLLWKHPNGEAMDDRDARRRWYESFLPSTLTDSGEPRLLHCSTNGFLASLTRDEALVLASKPGIRRMVSDYRYSFSRASCGFKTIANKKRSFVRSKSASI